MISAKRARYESEKFHEYVVKEQMERIEGKIELAASLGNLSYIWYGGMYETNKVKLMDAGYILIEATNKTTIYW